MKQFRSKKSVHFFSHAAKQSGILINSEVAQVENVGFSLVNSENGEHDGMNGKQEGYTNKGRRGVRSK